MPRRRLPAVLLGSMFGLVAPVCDCGAVPLARRLMAKGVPVFAAVSFLLAAPVVNPITLVATAVAFQGNVRVVILRVFMTLSVAVTVGLLASSRLDLRTLTRPDSASESVSPRPWRLVGHASAEYVDVLFFVVLGALFTAATQTLVPLAQLTTLGGQQVGSVLALMPVASVLSICSEADAFVARAFATNFSAGAVLAFMTIGQLVDLRMGLLVWRTLGSRLMLLIVIVSYPLVFAESVLLNRLLASS